MTDKKYGEIAHLIWKEFSGGPPERRAATTLFKLGMSSEELNKIAPHLLLPNYAINNTINELRNIEKL